MRRKKNIIIKLFNINILTPLPNRLPVAIANYVSKKGESCKVYFLISVDVFNVKKHFIVGREVG